MQLQAGSPYWYQTDHDLYMVSKEHRSHLAYLEKICEAFNISMSEFFSVVESGEREPVVLTQAQAEMLEKWSEKEPVNKNL